MPGVVKCGEVFQRCKHIIKHVTAHRTVSASHSNTVAKHTRHWGYWVVLKMNGKEQVKR